MRAKPISERRKSAQENWEKLQNSTRPVIYVGAGSCGRAAGATEVIDAIEAHLKTKNVDARVIEVGCIGPCYLEPLLDIRKPGYPRISYAEMTSEKAEELITSFLLHDDPRPDLALGTVDGTVPGIPPLFDHPMLKPQVRIATRNLGLISPEMIDSYVASEGY